MDRNWLLTWTTYATRLAGDRRGSVARVRTAHGGRRKRQLTSGSTALENAVRRRMLGPTVLLTAAQARHVLTDLRASAEYRGWELFAAAVMRNHVHVVVGAPGDPDPADLLRVFKAYASRALNERFARPQSGTWWTASGSRRRLPNEPAVIQAIRYVLDQPGALALWGIAPEERFS